MALLAVLVLLASNHFVSATVYGSDERLSPGSMLTPDEIARYSFTQMVVCEARGGVPSHGAAGTLAADFMHGISVAHVFYDEALQRMHRPDECKLRVYDGAGIGLQLIKITRIRTLWDGNAPRWPMRDLAMFEIDERAQSIDHYLSLPGQPVAVREGESVTVVAFHFDLEPKHAKRKTHGRAYSTFGSGDAGIPNIFHTDADWVKGSSGGTIYNSRGELVALVQGNTSPPGNHGARIFNPATDFNRAVRLDARFLELYAEFVQGR